MVKNRRRKQFDTTNLKTLVAEINNNSIDNLSTFTNQIKTTNLNSFADQLSARYVYEKMNGISGVDLHESEVFLTTAQYNDDVYAIKLSPQTLTPRMNKCELRNLASSLSREMSFGRVDGIVYFLPFQMNSTVDLATASKNIPLYFVNIPYNKRSLEGYVRSNNNSSRRK